MDQFIRGTVADQMQDYYRAIFHYQEALRYDSTSAFIHVALAQDYILLGNPELADSYLSRALTLDPDHPPALELKSLLLRGTGDLPKAREPLQRLTELFPDRTDYLKQLLTLDLQLKRYDEADRIYDKIVEKEGESEFLARQVMALYLSEQEHDRAIAYLQRLIARDSTDASLVYALGAAYQIKGDSVRAEQLLRQANRMEPTEPRYWAGIATMELNRQNYAEAVRLIDSSLAHSEEPTASLLNLKGVALQRLGRQSEAVTALKSALALDSTLVSAMGALALIYDQLDSLDQIEYYYQQAIAYSDSAAVYLNNLAYSFAQRAVQLERARGLSTRALQKDPKNGSYLDTMGWIEYQSGRYEEAARWLKRALRQTPDNPEVLEHLGDTYSAMGSPSKAKKFYQRALDKDPQNEKLRRKANS